MGVSEAQRARLVAKHRKEREAGTGRRSYHPAAAAHFHGFWADEDEDGKGDQQYVSAGVGPCRWRWWSWHERGQPQACTALALLSLPSKEPSLGSRA